MRPLKTALSILTLTTLLTFLAGIADAQEPKADLPRDLEIELALSALPPHLRTEATVYVLAASGTLEIARQGSNGFHTLVSRNDPNAFLGNWPHAEYRDDILVPIAFDAAGSAANIQVYFDMAELRAAGTSAEDLKATIQSRYERGEYKAPERAGISYMLAPVVRTYIDAEESDLVATWNVPHYMFYAPGVSNEQIGGKFRSEYPYVLNSTPGPHGYIIQFVGREEKEAINQEHLELIARLCDLRDAYCLPN